MKNIKEQVISPWRGSETTSEMVRDQVRERFGDEAADTFNPATDAMPFSHWLNFGFVVKKGEKALKSVTYVEVEDENGEVTKKFPRTVNLFHRLQVEKAS